MGDFPIVTDRLLLRGWRDEDSDPLYRIGQDPRVMEFLGPLTSREDSRRIVAGQIVNQELFGHCFWPIERLSDGALIGFCGLNPGPRNTPLEGKVEIGWRLAHSAWGHGYALEAATASLDWAWRNLPDDEILAITVAANARSWGLMERLGMIRMHTLDFDHPAEPLDSALRPHITYRLQRR